MPKKYPDEFRRRAVELVQAGQPVSRTAADLGITHTCLSNWVKQDPIDRGELPGKTKAESRELRKARRRIRELEDEVQILRRANAMLGTEARHLEGSTEVSTCSSTPGSRPSSVAEPWVYLPRATTAIAAGRCRRR